METIKIIDLLNRIANGEEVPNEFKHKQDTYFIDDGEYISIKGDGSTNYLFQGWILDKILNDEIELLDEEDEFEDIEEFQSFITNVGRVDNTNIELYIHTLFKQQTQLINNQKKIIMRLKDE